MAREPSEAAIVAYKTVLSEIIDTRPSGTRQRLADALGKHRSFVTQITSPAYSTPLPARHLPTIFRVCHFSAAEQDRFVGAYQLAHPDRLPETTGSDGLRMMSLMVPDLGDPDKNRKLDLAVQQFVQTMVTVIKDGE